MESKTASPGLVSNVYWPTVNPAQGTTSGCDDAQNCSVLSRRVSRIGYWRVVIVWSHSASMQGTPWQWVYQKELRFRRILRPLDEAHSSLGFVPCLDVELLLIANPLNMRFSSEVDVEFLEGEGA